MDTNELNAFVKRIHLKTKLKAYLITGSAAV